MTDPIARDRTRQTEMLLELQHSQSNWPGKSLKRLAVAVVCVAAILGLFFYLYTGESGGQVRYATEPVTRGDLTIVITATGSIEPTNKVEVSSELSGTVRHVLVDYNSSVKSGEILAELDTDKLKATVENSRAKLEAAKAKEKVAEVTVWETEREYNRKSELSKRNISSIHDLEIAQALFRRAAASYESAKADVAVAEAELKLNETNLSKAYIVSPVNGIVLSRNVEPGQTVASSLQAPVLFSIAEDLTQMDVQVDVDEADVGKVKVGQSASFTVDAYPERTFPAKIRELYFASEVVQGVVTYKALLMVENSDLALRPGMTATAQISVQQVRDALLVPNAALRFSPPVEDASKEPGLLGRLFPGPPRFRTASQKEETGSSRKVWVLQEGSPIPIAVRVGASDGKRTEIVSGALKPDQAVIVDSTLLQ